MATMQQPTLNNHSSFSQLRQLAACE